MGTSALRFFAYRKNDVLVVPLAIQVFRYLLLFSNEIKRERWVDEDISIAIFRLPEERRPRRSTCNPGFSLPLAFQ